MKLLIFGSREFAPTVFDLIRHCGHEQVGMIDDFNTGPGILGSFEAVRITHPPSEHGVALAIGYSNLNARWQAWTRIRAAGYPVPALIHPRAYVADNAHIGEGSMIMAGAIIDVRARLGEAVVAWPGACVNHDARIGDNTFLSPNATVCGFSSIGAHSFIGAGATVADHCDIPESSFIKMHSSYTGPRR